MFRSLQSVTHLLGVCTRVFLVCVQTTHFSPVQKPFCYYSLSLLRSPHLPLFTLYTPDRVCEWFYIYADILANVHTTVYHICEHICTTYMHMGFASFNPSRTLFAYSVRHTRQRATICRRAISKVSMKSIQTGIHGASSSRKRSIEDDNHKISTIKQARAMAGSYT